MAKETAFKVKKPKPAVVAEESTQTQVAEAPEGAEEGAEEEAEEAAPAPTKPKRKLEQAAKAETPENWVEFTCFETIDPSPTVGNFSFNRDLSITKLEAKKVYTMPREVAEVLVDKKKGVINP